jgi:hypothetical protein
MTSVQPGMFVLTSVVAMQRHVDYVRRGYHWYVTGVVPARKAERLRVKFADRYCVDEHRNVRARRRARGEGAAVLLMYQPCSSAAEDDHSPGNGVGETVVGWTLLITEGEHPARALEKLKDALDESQRLTLGPYQLIRRTRGGQVNPAWTWAMTRAEYSLWRDRVIRSARGDAGHSSGRVLVELYRTPGFAGIRSQVGHVVSLYRREWGRRQRGSDPFPRLPKLGYVQRLANEFAATAAFEEGALDQPSESARLKI